MKRQRIKPTHSYDNYRDSRNDAEPLDRIIPLQSPKIRRENILEAQILEGDTLQAIALRCNCTISDIKRLNKIEKEIEIHARKTIKVPTNAHSLLLNTQDELPSVHTSGQNSPKIVNNNTDELHNPLFANNKSKLDEKLLVASVSLATPAGSSTLVSGSINDIILNSAITRKEHNIDGVDFDDALDGEHARLIDSDDIQSAPHAIRGVPSAELSCSGSDCDISWICLLVFILALCFAIPLIYIFYIAEHPEKFHHSNV